MGCSMQKGSSIGIPLPVPQDHASTQVLLQKAMAASLASSWEAVTLQGGGGRACSTAGERRKMSRTAIIFGDQIQLSINQQGKISEHHWGLVGLQEQLAEQGVPLDEVLQVAPMFRVVGMPEEQRAKQVYWLASSLFVPQQYELGCWSAKVSRRQFVSWLWGSSKTWLPAWIVIQRFLLFDWTFTIFRHSEAEEGLAPSESPALALLQLTPSSRVQARQTPFACKINPEGQTHFLVAFEQIMLGGQGMHSTAPSECVICLKETGQLETQFWPLIISCPDAWQSAFRRQTLAGACPMTTQVISRKVSCSHWLTPQVRVKLSRRLEESVNPLLAWIEDTPQIEQAVLGTTMYFKFLYSVAAKLVELMTPPQEARGRAWGSKTAKEKVREVSWSVVFVVKVKTSCPSFMYCLSMRKLN